MKRNSRRAIKTQFRPIKCRRKYRFIKLSVLQMDFDILLRRYKLLFSLYGLGEFDTRARVSPTWESRFMAIFPAVSYLILVIVLCCFAIYFRSVYSAASSTLNNFFAYSHFSFEILLQLCIIVQTIFSREKLKRVVLLYDSIQKYMWKRLNHGIHFKNFENSVNRILLIVLLPGLIVFIWRTVVSIRNFQKPFYIILLPIYLLSVLVQLHIIVHVELLKFLQNTTTQWLHGLTLEFSAKNLHQPMGLLEMQSRNSHLFELQHLKWIHFKLWENSVNFNQIFGWSLAAMISRNAAEIAYGVCWVFFYKSVKTTTYMILIRKAVHAIIGANSISIKPIFLQVRYSWLLLQLHQLQC